MKNKLTTGLATAFAALVALAPGAHAQDTYLGTIQEFPYQFCPRGWAAAEGQLLPINQNTALFSLLGTQFGGDGRTTFALPDLRPTRSSPPPASSLKAEVYQHCQFSGWSVSLAPGDYPLSALLGFTDNDMSSIRLPDGWTATLCDGTALDGASMTASSTDACLVNEGFNDRVSSIVIRNNGETNPSQPASPGANDAAKLKTCIALQGIYPSRN